MEKIISVLAVLLVLMIFATSCNDKTIEKVDEDQMEYTYSMFVEIENTGVWTVVYHRDTKVMYVLSSGYNNCGEFTLLVDAGGNPMLYENDDK